MKELIEYVGYEWKEFKNYKDVDNKFLKSVRDYFYKTGKISQKQDEVVYRILSEIRLGCSLYEERNDKCRDTRYGTG